MASDADDEPIDHDKIKRITREYEIQATSRHEQDVAELRTRFLALNFWQRWLLRRTVSAIEEAGKSLPMLGRDFMFASIIINLDATPSGHGQHKLLACEILPLLDEWEPETSDRN